MNRFIEHIINDLVRDTRIDYDREEIHFPFFRLPSVLSPFFFSSLLFLSFFPKYCIDVYGLTEDEIKYVFNEYKTIILDKITNR